MGMLKSVTNFSQEEQQLLLTKPDCTNLVTAGDVWLTLEIIENYAKAQESSGEIGEDRDKEPIH